ncbi:MAG: germination protein YpeB [Oscillospiraceae bacterium]|nr:germination protein YpeB [Oscillospiraceae bacterium]
MNESRESANGSLGRMLVALLAGIVVVLGIWGGYTWWRNVQYRRSMESAYRRAVQEAAVNLSNISTDLVKGMYSGSSSQLSQLSAKLWKEASTAKSAISALPVAELHLDNTNQFLSQVGDYAMYLSRKSANGQTLSSEEWENFRKLREYADRLSEAMDELDDSLERGDITFEEIAQLVAAGVDTDDLDDEMPSIVTNTSLDAMEGGFSGYPTLIYDGPFSDHILDKTPVITQTQPEISADQAKAIAQKAAGEAVELSNYREEDSTLPCYVFYSDNCSVAVSKNGGQLCYLIRSKGEEVEERLSPAQAISAARIYLNQLGLQSMKDSYYEIDDGIITINFAYETQDAICYTDLIKIAVAMDDGEVVSYDARGYLVNHRERSFVEPSLSAEQAQEVLSRELSVRKSRLALIPTEGENEVLCWEFDCEGSAGDHVLVYVNANTGVEEQILLLIEDEDGVLTK